jgi:hypothetical protein
MNKLGQGNARLAVSSLTIDDQSPFLRIGKITAGKPLPTLFQGNIQSAGDVPGSKLFPGAAVYKDGSGPRKKILRLGERDETDSRELFLSQESLLEFAPDEPPHQGKIDCSAEDDTQQQNNDNPAEKVFQLHDTKAPRSF